MNDRERVLAVLNYQSYDRLPLLHFGFWRDTLAKWAREGHLTADDVAQWADGNPTDRRVGRLLGFDANYYTVFRPTVDLLPPFAHQVLEELPDGSRKVLNERGVVILEKDGVTSIPQEIDHTLKGRAEWERLFLPKLQYSIERITAHIVHTGETSLPFFEGGLDYLRRPDRTDLLGLHCGSLYGVIRNWLGLVGLSYLLADDENLLDEMIQTLADLSYQCTKTVLEMGARFDFGHFWEDICFNHGPLVRPAVFKTKVGPHYRRITRLLRHYGITIVSLDCDGKIDELIPTWIENGVNTMFPIEVGTWHASIEPWRREYGQEIRGVGGMDKRVFARDYAAVDREIERLKPLVDLGGYLPCPDHRIAPDAKWETIQYYCERMRVAFGG